VDGARDAVLELQVHLWDGVLGEDGGIGDITCTEFSVSHLLFILSYLHSQAIHSSNSPGIRSVFDVRIAADSTMLRMVNLLMALSFGVHREQLEHLTGLTWPRPFLLRPLEQYISAWS